MIKAEIGGRNLLKKKYEIADYGYGMKILELPKLSSIMREGEKYTISFDLLGEEGNEIYSVLMGESILDIFIDELKTISTDKVRHDLSFEVSPEIIDSEKVHLFFSSNTTDIDYIVKNIKIGLAFDKEYSLAPEDYLQDEVYLNSITYSHAKLKIDDYWNRGIFGTNIKIGIVDDGVGTHDALPVEGGYACGKHTSYRQENDHATHCAGIALSRNLKNGEPTGIAPGAKLYSIRMYHKTYVDRVNSLIEAIDYAIEEGIDILSMSTHIAENSINLDDGRGSSHGIPKHMRIKLRNAFIKAYEHGIIICVAAGNHNKGNGKDNIEFEELLPKMPNVVVVANLAPDDSRYETSGVGRWVDLSGYGYRVKSTLPNNKYGYLTGTSMSTPQIAGVFALYKQMFPSLAPQKIIELVFENCQPVENLNEKQQGRGIPLPPPELYELSVLPEAENRIMVQNDLTWVATETFSRDNNGEWIRAEAVGYEK